MKLKKEHSILYGIHPVLEALTSTPCAIKKIYISKERKNPNVLKIFNESRKKKIEIIEINKKSLENKFGIVYHQGVVGVVSDFIFTPVEDLVKHAFRETPSPVIALLDSITDPGNLGGVIRSAEALKIQGIIVPKDRSAPISPAVFKRSVGAIFHFLISRVTNLPQTIAYLKKEGFWIIGTHASAKVSIWDFKFEGPTAVVLGSESKGLRKLVSEKCDFTVSIPMYGRVKSLNVASASAVIFYEINRQKDLSK